MISLIRAPPTRPVYPGMRVTGKNGHVFDSCQDYKYNLKMYSFNHRDSSQTLLISLNEKQGLVFPEVAKTKNSVNGYVRHWNTLFMPVDHIFLFILITYR